MRFKAIIWVMLWCNVPLTGFSQSVSLQERDSSIAFMLDEIPVLVYQKSKAAVPLGVDTIYSKSGFIHPLRTASGQILTRIQPVDHYHHYGIWGPWTKTNIQHREVDFWNLGDAKGRVEFDRVLEKREDELGAEILVRQNHWDLTSPPSTSLAMLENLKIRVEPLPSGRFQVDYITEFTNQLDVSILFEAYRYGGGIAFRAREDWGSENSMILTSEGKNREDSDEAKARWVLVSGNTNSSQGSSGLLILSHPENFDHPEPLRVWPEDSYEGIGNVFLNFTPTRFNSLEILPGKTYGLQYRLIVFDGKLTISEAEEYWKSFSEEK